MASQIRVSVTDGNAEYAGRSHAGRMRCLETSGLEALNVWVIGARYADARRDAKPDSERLIGHARTVLDSAALALIRTVDPQPEES